MIPGWVVAPGLTPPEAGKTRSLKGRRLENRPPLQRPEPFAITKSDQVLPS
jgi:hypothetical protein